jgi:hypothetical protein
VHGKRLNPAARLLKLAEKNIGPYGEEWEGLEIGPVLELARETVRKLEAEKFEKNPWNPKQKPRIELPKTQ